MGVRFSALFILLTSPVITLPQATDINFEPLRSYEGLGNNHIRCILQDDTGFMWFGTQNGLYKYDGYKFTGYFHDPGDPNSLSYNWVSTLCKDRSGNLWIGTFGGGLNKFNSRKELFTRYQHDNLNPQNLCNNYIMDICADMCGNIWIATRSGLSQLYHTNFLDSQKVGFINHYFNANDNIGLGYNDVSAVYAGNDCTIWIGTDAGDVIRFSYAHNKFTREITPRDVYRLWDLDFTLRTQKSIIFIGRDPADLSRVVTIGSQAGIYKYDTEHKQLIDCDRKLAGLMHKNPGATINDYLLLNDGSIWAASSIACYIVNPHSNQISQGNLNPANSNRSSDVLFSDLAEDRSGTLWIASMGAGLNIYDKKRQMFNRYKIETDSICYTVTAVFEDPEETAQKLWLGTRNHGLLEYDRIKNQIRPCQEKIVHLISAICQSEADYGCLLIGTLGGGLYLYDKQNETLAECIYHKPSNEQSYHAEKPKSLLLTSVLVDKNGKRWLGSLDGLYQFDPKTNEYTLYLHEPTNSNTISSNRVSALYEFHYGTASELWIGTRTGGLNKLDRETGTFIRFTHNPDDPASLNADYISAIHGDNSGNLWIGTPRGLNRYNRHEGTFTRFMDREQKLNAEVLCILPDDSGYLWLNTMSGLHRFNPKTGDLRTYEDPFNRWAYHRGASGEMYFASGSKLFAFDPTQIKDHMYIPPVVLTDFQIFNQSVQVGPEKISPLQQSITETAQITLSHDQSVFSFEFAVLDYRDPLKNKCAYKMEGIDPEWVYTDASRRFATYTQLAPGEYVFRVKGANSHGIWNDKGRSITIIISPPWWKTTWAYAGYLVVFSLLAYGLRKYDLKRQRLKHALELEQLHAQKLEEIDHIKSRFFANISHEFRTPLTLILGPVKQMLAGEFAGNIKEQYHMIIRNAERLLKLINQLLELSKLESGALKLQARPCDIIRFTREVVQVFESLAVRKKIRLVFKSNVDFQEAYIDEDKFEKIINNLLSNAFKFTPGGGGEIVVTTSNPPVSLLMHKGGIEGGLEISVSNTGPAIAAEEQEKIFDRFYRADFSHKRDHEGSGIGLALTRELVELHHGTISVRSEPEDLSIQGDAVHRTTFTIMLPLGKAHLLEEEIIPTTTTHETIVKSGSDQLLNEDSVQVQKLSGIPQSSPEATGSHQLPTDLPSGTPLLLVIEDNPDMRHYIRSRLDRSYRIIEAEDGEAGFKKARSKLPDLIVCDVMMPRIDGMELCSLLKNDRLTSHIPVILLTARAGSEDKIEGLETGADDYMAKPFDPKELEIRIGNLITQRRKLRERFSWMQAWQPEKITVTSTDKAFLDTTLEIIERHISEPGFTVDRFGKELAMSRSQLYRKIRALTNLTPHMYIRLLRLRRAAYLLQHNAGNIAQIAYETGYNSPAHFAKAFRELYGKAPSEYSKKSPH